MYGIEEMYEHLLLEAKSTEEIKKIYEYQFLPKGVPQEVIDRVFEIDPTRKKSYTKWVLLQWGNSSKQILEALNNGRMEKMFHTFQERAGSGLQLAAMKNFDEAMSMLPDDDPIFNKEGDPDAPENQFDIVYDSPEWRIALPHTYEADKKLGQGCRWCTAGAFGDNDGYWKRYSASGPLWVNFDKTKSEICPMDHKEYPYKRYQFCFEHGNWAGELMDSNDDRIDISNIGMPEGAIEFYREQNERYAEIIENGSEATTEERYEEYYDARAAHSYTLIQVDNQYLDLMPEESDDYNMNFDGCEYYVYDTSWDSSDPVDWTEYDPDDCIAFSPNEDNRRHEDDDIYPFIVLKAKYRNRTMVYYMGEHHWESQVTDKYGKIEGCDFPYYVIDGAKLYYYPEALSYESVLYLEDGDFSKIFFNAQMECDDFNYAFETINADGSHSLYSESGIIIESDYPINGEYFTSIEKNGIHYAVGKWGKYRLESYHNGEYDDENWHFVRKVTDTIGIICNGQKFDVINTENGQRLFNDPSINLIETAQLSADSSIYLKVGKFKSTGFAIYDINGKVIIPHLENLLVADDSHGIWIAIYGENKADILKADKDGLHKLIEANKAFKGDNMDGLNFPSNIIVYYIKGDGYHLFDTKTLKSHLPKGVTGLGTFNTSKPLVCARKGDGDIFVINLETEKILANGLAARMPTWCAGDVYKFRTKDGKYNVFNSENGTLLGEDIDKIADISTSKDWWIGYNNNKVFWFSLDGSGRVLPSREGIDLSLINALSIERTNGFSFVFNKDTGELLNIDTPLSDNNVLEAKARYDPSTNTVTVVSIEDINRIYSTTNISKRAKQIAEKIAKDIVFHNTAPIAEQFNKMFRRMLSSQLPIG